MLVAQVAPSASPEQSLVAVQAFVQTPQLHAYPFEQSDCARHTSRKWPVVPASPCGSVVFAAFLQTPDAHVAPAPNDEQSALVEHCATQADPEDEHDAAEDAAMQLVPLGAAAQSVGAVHAFVHTPQKHSRPFAQSPDTAHSSSQFELLPD